MKKSEKVNEFSKFFKKKKYQNLDTKEVMYNDDSNPSNLAVILMDEE